MNFKFCRHIVRLPSIDDMGSGDKDDNDDDTAMSKQTVIMWLVGCQAMMTSLGQPNTQNASFA